MLKIKPFKTYAYIYSLNKGQMESTKQDEVLIIEKIDTNKYIAQYKNKICSAIFNGFNCCYYVDDIYGIIKEID